jgi:hypothetical protein
VLEEKVKKKKSMSQKQNAIVLSAWGIASFSVAGAVLAVAFRNYRNNQLNTETSKLAESSVHNPFSVKEWQFSARSRTGSMDEVEGNTFQRPVVHSTMGGLAATRETIALVMVMLLLNVYNKLLVVSLSNLSFFFSFTLSLFLSFFPPSII